MPHLARPTSRKLTNKSGDAQRFVASPQHPTVSLRLTDQVKSFHHPEAAPQEIGGTASGIFLSSRAGKAEPNRYVLRQSRVCLVRIAYCSHLLAA